VLVDEGGGVVNLVVNHDVEVFLGGMGLDVGVGEGFGHGEGLVGGCGEGSELKRVMMGTLEEKIGRLIYDGLGNGWYVRTVTKTEKGVWKLPSTLVALLAVGRSMQGGLTVPGGCLVGEVCALGDWLVAAGIPGRVAVRHVKIYPKARG